VLDNSAGKILAFNEGANVTIEAANNIINTGGSIVANADTDLILDNFYTVTGDFLTGGHLSITATGMANNGNIQANDYITLNLTQGGFTNNAGAKLISGTSIAIDALTGNVVNNGEISAPLVSLNINNGSLNNSGTLSSGSTLD